MSHFQCKLVVICSPFFWILLETCWRALGVFGSLDPFLLLLAAHCRFLDLIPALVLCCVCLCPGTRTRMFIPEKCCPTLVWPASPVTLSEASSLPQVMLAYFHLSLRRRFHWMRKSGSRVAYISLFKHIVCCTEVSKGRLKKHKLCGMSLCWRQMMRHW